MWRKLLFFSLLYFVQGAALAYVINFQKPYLAGQGISKQAIGVFTGLLLIPFIAKVLLGFVSDRFPLGHWGKRKPYMIFGLLLFAACYFAVSFVRPGDHFILFASLTWLASLGLAWFDTCADGWAVDVASDAEQSNVQAAMVAGKSLGLICMSAIFGLLGLRYGFSMIFWIMAGLAVLVIPMVLLAKHQPRQGSGLMHGWHDLLKPIYILFASYAIVYSIASFGTDGILTLFMSEEKGASTLDLGFFGMWRGGGALIGALAFAIVRPRIGMRGSLICALLILGGACLLPLLDLPSSVGAVLWGTAWGFQETAFVTLAMRFAVGPWAATLFAGSMIFSNLGTSLGEGLGTPLVPSIGFEGVFIMFACLAWAAIIFVPKLTKK